MLIKMGSKIALLAVLALTCTALGKDKKSDESEGDTVPAEFVETEIYDDSPFTEPSNLSFFYSGKSKYEASLNGITKYMGDLKKSSPKDHKSISPEFNKLVKQKERAKTWSLYMAGTGGVVLLSGLTILQEEERDANGQVEKKPNIGLVAGGFILGFVGSMVYLYLNPEEPEYLDFVKKHNKKVKSKIRWDLGYHPTNKAPQVSLGYNF